jgi:hypothetical protein
VTNAGQVLGDVLQLGGALLVPAALVLYVVHRIWGFL